MCQVSIWEIQYHVNLVKNVQVVEMEKDILKFINFEVSNPTTKTFIR